jgi:hypothetical protein
MASVGVEEIKPFMARTVANQHAGEKMEMHGVMMRGIGKAGA